MPKFQWCQDDQQYWYIEHLKAAPKQLQVFLCSEQPNGQLLAMYGVMYPDNPTGVALTQAESSPAKWVSMPIQTGCRSTGMCSTCKILQNISTCIQIYVEIMCCVFSTTWMWSRKIFTWLSARHRTAWVSLIFSATPLFVAENVSNFWRWSLANSATLPSCGGQREGPVVGCDAAAGAAHLRSFGGPLSLPAPPGGHNCLPAGLPKNSSRALKWFSIFSETNVFNIRIIIYYIYYVLAVFVGGLQDTVKCWHKSQKFWGSKAIKVWGCSGRQSFDQHPDEEKEIENQGFR